MEKKKVFKRSNSLWSLFNRRNPGKSFLRRFNNSPSNVFSWFLNKTKGFTLIELIVVIGILAILSVTALVALNPVAQFQKANDSRRKSDLAQIQKALETYYQDKGSYPISLNSRITSLDDSGRTITVDWGTSWQPYMNLLPKDPIAFKHYVYYSITGQSYYLYASLDRGSLDPQSCQNLINGECQHVSGANLCGAKCNYGATSPNVSP